MAARDPKPNQNKTETPGNPNNDNTINNTTNNLVAAREPSNHGLREDPLQRERASPVHHDLCLGPVGTGTQIVSELPWRPDPHHLALDIGSAVHRLDVGNITPYKCNDQRKNWGNFGGFC